MTAMNIDRNCGEAIIDFMKVVGAALLSSSVPGFFIGLFIAASQCLEQRADPTVMLLPLFTAVFGIAIGAPFSLFVFAPTVFLLRGYARLGWLEMIGIGILSVVVGLALFASITGALNGSWAGLPVMLTCGAVAGFVFWLMVGDMDVREDEGEMR